MQISRHWRMKAQRYRLEGVRYKNGRVSLSARRAVETAQDQMASDARDIEAVERRPVYEPSVA